jgi:predicted SAM-dependent methyltransferase
VDFRNLPGLDVVADVRKLPFDRGSVDEIMSAHLIEHFRERQFEAVVLPYWRSLLKIGGTLRIICPNWQALIEEYAGGRLSLEDFKLATFGLQIIQAMITTPCTHRSLCGSYLSKPDLKKST